MLAADIIPQRPHDDKQNTLDKGIIRKQRVGIGDKSHSYKKTKLK
jgi:hypothetical protein